MEDGLSNGSLGPVNEDIIVNKCIMAKIIRRGFD